jgi:hypothetical protein
MRSEMNFKDVRLLEALDHLDPEFIDEALDIMRIPPAKPSPERDRKTTILSLKLIVALAASLLIISACIPVLSNLIRNYFVTPGGLASSGSEVESLVPDSGSGEETTSPEQTDYSDIENLPALYRAVLKNEKEYYARYLNKTGARYISDPPTQYGIASFLRYAAVDMDGDGEIEIAVRNSHMLSDILVLHIDGSRVYGFVFNYTQIEEIEDDGNFIWSDFGTSTGYSSIIFKGGYEYALNEICSKSATVQGFRYFVSGKEATREEYYAVYDTLSKTEVTWYPLDKYTHESTSAEETTAPADVEYDGSRGLEYRINSDGRTVTLVGYGSCKDRDVTVATLYDGKPVTAVGASAFENCRAVYSVTLPEGLSAIGDKAFKGCEVLSTVNIPEGVRVIGSEAFKNCKSLTGITLPESVTEIGDGAFAYCSNLREITLPSRVDQFGTHTFEWCTSLVSVALPEGVRLLDCTFYVCESLKSVTLPRGITEIGTHSFNGCTSLQSITLPSSVEKLGSFSFSGCYKLTEFKYNAVLSRWIGDVQKEEYWNQHSPFTAVTCLDGELLVSSMTEEDALALVAAHLGLKKYTSDPDWLWVRKYPSDSSPKYRIAHSVRKDGLYPVVAWYEVDVYSQEITSVTYDLADIPENIRAVIKNERTFINGNMGEMYFKDSESASLYRPAQYGNVDYTVLDLDGDGNSEMIINGMDGYVILHDTGKEIRAYYCGARSMYGLKTDGTYDWTDLTVSGEYGIQRITGFTESSYLREDLCHIREDADGTRTYYVGGNKVSEAEYDAFVATLSPEEVSWRELDYYPIYMQIPN